MAVGASAFTIAILGAGPKGLFALESILAQSHTMSAKLRIDLFDPQEPGIGAAYQPSLPNYLRLNVDANIVSTWPRERRSALRPSWREWAQSVEPTIAAEGFPSRAAVGRYFRWSFQRLVESAPHVQVRHIASTVTDLRRSHCGRWHVLPDTDRGPYDEVLLTVGHGATWDGALLDAGETPVTSVYPIENLDTVAPHTRVRFRGAALTFIDGALALTEGRGGRFEGHGAHCRYVRSGSEPRSIYPSSRSGSFLHAKPRTVLPRNATDAALKEWTKVDSGDVDSMEESIVGAAHAILWELGVPAAHERILETLRTGWDPAQPLTGAVGVRAVDAFRESVEIGRGEKHPGPAYALGRAWAIGYQTVVDRFPGPSPDWEKFMALAATLERFAFGPPLVNAEKLLALIDAGLVVSDYIAGSLADGGPYDKCIDAVLPPPGWRRLTDPLVTSLRDSGHVSIPDGRRGIMITDDAQVIGNRGATHGLSALGRPTEDTVIGNDTLNRALHDTPERWATRVMRRIEGTG
ncbi:FAD/NAD(P)-binding protein [Hoyosella rhizosphaerae]|uniref:FAD-dependent urate hydroxylase HpyO/Asp monooxygenase CreE-like FAD/NAD(P)-binding domain-containing protein n=1 Tax=Hoyosella rhizosphaerae TaxID=1755582 RepID=A0A916UD44_9ACTN|nr:FAD/NAD(P)-binding domain-containing protein [Hoyosella rhizosphaerae]MBN4925702.1 FAD/NAD(P)-binding protein [Hoyosella rhizosphaerae]GGC68612.1 hypothetical protein GCM10011410_21700 [Hoyosella rhizosphaerae]